MSSAQRSSDNAHRCHQARCLPSIYLRRASQLSSDSLPRKSKLRPSDGALVPTLELDQLYERLRNAFAWSLLAQ